MFVPGLHVWKLDLRFGFETYQGTGYIIYKSSWFYSFGGRKNKLLHVTDYPEWCTGSVTNCLQVHWPYDSPSARTVSVLHHALEGWPVKEYALLATQELHIYF